MIRDEIVNGYFYWLLSKVCETSLEQTKYYDLFCALNSIDFCWDIPLDANRAIDGEELRAQYAFETDRSERIVELYIDWPCSVLEMMVALAIRCETHIMGYTSDHDRTPEWFWAMINNLGLQDMVDDNFDERVIVDVIDRMMHHDYRPNGEGGLFILQNPPKDMRQVEIWYQLNWYLNEILDE